MRALTRREFTETAAASGAALPLSVSPSLATSTYFAAKHHDLKTFLDWFEENRYRFQFIVIFDRVDDDYLKFSFLVLRNIIRGYINWSDDYVELGILVHDVEEFMDEIFNPFAHPALTEDGWICKECLECDKNTCVQIFDTVEELLADHVFIPFLEWVNERLAKADSLDIYASDGMTWARLAGKGKDFISFEGEKKYLVRSLPVMKKSNAQP